MGIRTRFWRIHCSVSMFWRMVCNVKGAGITWRKKADHGGGRVPLEGDPPYELFRRCRRPSDENLTGHAAAFENSRNAVPFTVRHVTTRHRVVSTISCAECPVLRPWNLISGSTSHPSNSRSRASRDHTALARTSTSWATNESNHEDATACVTTEAACPFKVSHTHKDHTQTRSPHVVKGRIPRQYPLERKPSWNCTGSRRKDKGPSPGAS